MDVNTQSPHIQIIQEQQEDENHLKDYWAVFKRRWWIIALVIFIVLALSFVYLKRTPRQYEAVSIVKLPTQSNSGLAVALGAFLPIGPSGDIMTEVEIIKGRTIAVSIIQKLGLDKKESNLKLDPRLIVSEFRKSLRVSQRGRSNMIAITATGDSAKEAKDIANEIANEYIQISEVSNQKLWNTLIKQMQDKLSEAEADLMESRMSLHEHEAEQGITTAFGPLLVGGGGMLQSRSGDSGSQYMIPEALQAVAQLKANIIEMEIRLDLLRQSLPEAHPNIINLKDQIAVSSQRLEEEQEKAIERYNKQFGLTESAANVVLNQQLYTSLVTKQEELKAQYIMQNRLPEIVEEAIEPIMHSKPREILILMSAVLLGLFLGVGSALFWEYMDKSLHTYEDVERFAELPVIGRISHLRGAKHHFIGREDGKRGTGRVALINAAGSSRSENRRAAYRESYRMLQLEMMALVNGKVKHAGNIQHQGALTLLVTSSVKKEGKSLVAANLAISIAQTGGRVLLIDANHRSSIQHKLLDVGGGTGWIDVLTGNAAPTDAVKNTSLDNLYLANAGGENSQTDPSTLLMSSRLDDLIEALKGQFDFIIFDSAPVTLASESVAIGSKADGVILVIKANDTKRDAILEAKQRLQNSGGNILGAVLNW